jgi:hypothetical protein
MSNLSGGIPNVELLRGTYCPEVYQGLVERNERRVKALLEKMKSNGTSLLSKPIKKKRRK